MKRFYCTICKRIKRVRKYPLSVQSVNNEMPEHRVGQCSWHHPSQVRRTQPDMMKVGQ